MPYGIAGVSQLQENVKTSIAAIEDTIKIVNKLPGDAQVLFRIVAMNKVYPVPLFLFPGMVVRIVNPHCMAAPYQSFRQMFGELLKTAVVVGNPAGAQDADFHFQ